LVLGRVRHRKGFKLGWGEVGAAVAAVGGRRGIGFGAFAGGRDGTSGWARGERGREG
jgi:hypothetical protein